jgi:hypothetical protein
MGLKLGFNAKLYRLTTGTRAAWTGSAPAACSEVSNVANLTQNISKDKGDASVRAGAGFKLVASGLKATPIAFTMMWDPTDTHLTALQTAFFANTQVAMLVLDDDKAVSGAQGLWADFEVTKFEQGQPINGNQTVNVEIEPGYSAVPPAWVKVT